MSISLIIPIKNRAHLIGKTLDNILSQTKKPSEIIIVDDASEDNLQNTLLPYKREIIFLKNSGKGPGAARNTGLKIATGNYIQFFDSDDLMTNNKLEEQYKLLNKSSNGIIIGPYVKAVETTSGWKQLDVIMQYKNLPQKLNLYEWVLRGWCSITQACLFKTLLLKDIGNWSEDLMPHEDLEYWSRLAKLNPYPLHTNKCCVIYRQHGDQITVDATTINNRVQDGFTALKKIQSQQIKSGFISEIIFMSRIYHQKKLLNLSKKNINKEFFLFFYRLYNKKERFLTGSDWERMHGPNKARSVFQKYLEIL